MTATTMAGSSSVAAAERRTVQIISALFLVAIPAVVAGLFDDAAGAVVAAVGGLALLGITARHVGLSAVRRLDWGLAGVLLMVASPFAPARLGWSIAGIGADDLPLLAGVALAGMSVIRTEGISGLGSRFAWPLYAFALWNGIVTVISSEFTATDLARGLGRWTLMALALSIVVTVGRRPGRGLAILAGIVVVGLAEALFGLWAYAVDWTVESDTRAVLIGLERWRDYQLLFGQTPGRISGTLGVSSNFFGALMLVPSLIAAGWSQKAETRMAALAFGAAAVATIYALALSYTRASLIALAVGGMLGALLIRRVRFISLVAGCLVLVFLTTPVLQRFNEGNDRAALASSGLDAILEDPATGVGSGRFVDSLYDEDAPVLIATPHNSFLLAAVETGIPGGVLFLLAAAWPAAVLLARVGLKTRGDPVLAAICAALLAFGVQALSNNIFHIPGVAVSYWIAMGSGLALTREPGQEAPQLG